MQLPRLELGVTSPRLEAQSHEGQRVGSWVLNFTANIKE